MAKIHLLMKTPLQIANVSLLVSCEHFGNLIWQAKILHFLVDMS